MVGIDTPSVVVVLVVVSCCLHDLGTLEGLNMLEVFSAVSLGAVYQSSNVWEQQIKGMEELNPFPGRMPFLSFFFFGCGEASISLWRTSDFLTSAFNGGRRRALPLLGLFADRAVWVVKGVSATHPLFILASLLRSSPQNNCLWILGLSSIIASRNTFVETVLNVCLFLKMSIRFNFS